MHLLFLPLVINWYLIVSVIAFLPFIFPIAINDGNRLQIISFSAQNSIMYFSVPQILKTKSLALLPAWIKKILIYLPSKWVLDITFGTTVFVCFWYLDIYLLIINTAQRNAPIKIFKRKLYSLLYRLCILYLLFRRYKHFSHKIQ